MKLKRLSKNKSDLFELTKMYGDMCRVVGRENGEDEFLKLYSAYEDSFEAIYTEDFSVFTCGYCDKPKNFFSLASYSIKDRGNYVVIGKALADYIYEKDYDTMTSDVWGERALEIMKKVAKAKVLYTRVIIRKEDYVR